MQKPRNFLVALLRNRRFAKHGKTNKAKRRQEAVQLKKKEISE